MLATAGPPPAFALLSTASVRLSVDVVRIAVQSHSSVVRQLGGSCSLLVPTADRALRMTVEAVSSRDAGAITLLTGTVTAIVPTIELPWRLELSFRPSELPGREAFLAYWDDTRTWLENGARGPGPTPPQLQALAGTSRHERAHDLQGLTSDENFAPRGSCIRRVPNVARAQLENLDRPDSLAQRAYAALRTAIRNGALVQGETYSEAEISSSMGISRTPVREALIELSREGLVEIMPQRGFRLRVMTVHEQQEVFALRAVLEALVVQQLAGISTPKDVAALRRFLKTQGQCLNDPVEFLTLDEQFHLLMPRLAGLRPYPQDAHDPSRSHVADRSLGTTAAESWLDRDRGALSDRGCHRTTRRRGRGGSDAQASSQHRHGDPHRRNRREAPRSSSRGRRPGEGWRSPQSRNTRPLTSSFKRGRRAPRE